MATRDANSSHDLSGVLISGMADVDEYPTADAVTVGDVLARVGHGLLRVAHTSPRALDQVVTGVEIYDALVELPSRPGTVLLAVGTSPASSQATDLITHASARRYAAVVFHDSEDPTLQLDAFEVPDALAVLITPAGVPWVHLANILRVGATESPQELAGVALGDLFGFANSLASRVGGAVTIENPQSQVLAYSSGNQDVDEPRKETILGRQVPEKYMRLLQERGVFRKLQTTEDVVEMEAMDDVNLSRRVVISVRAADEVLGSIWTAETGQPLVADHRAILREAARTAALHLMLHRLDLHAEDNLRRSMVRDVLNGVAADVAGARLALVPDASYLVLAFEGQAGAVPTRNRLLHVIELYCSITGREAFTLTAGARVYVLLLGDPSGRTETRRFAKDGARRATSALQAPVYAAIGKVVRSVDRIVDSRVEADRVMRVLLRPELTRAVADLDDVRAHANLLEVLDSIRDRPHLQEGPLSRIREIAPVHAESLIDTLRAYVDHLGDVRAAAEHMNVHPNTFRYRLRRAAELAEITLDDPTERLMLALQLRLTT